ncbi:NADH dehydrogenase [ubiquinone] 1 alpha subcomplex subunit 13 [Tribolium castaneum]|uniref:NADH dehydrogenase [ubiquinone] 1 alpha subcomplex subunit 13 n=1 Tax=Tribolium castaneum TaxID=7070 RepID=D6WAR0_TRICA|nr:PREDICTED: NADH dehydrogenase [ubiquinone] 1 alpha subcomplex subunit 13 [Tribolium castaneum]EEZ99191.1 NADH dehydrogenase (ubiquinone) 1 alpha subcomplex, 13 [Tribolium castaneum]|eukprot:XP_967059.1 PREDICTED: NADH dehydrogenase [ubiquinone] 1 alpha subcomplex subunit 13 [Tribolium castaneum]
MATAAAKKQDMPPSGGYRPINFKRVPARSYFSGWALFGGYLGMTAAASYLYYLNCKQVQANEIEMRSGRFAIFPLLLAERDREYLKQLRRNRDEEAKLMANVEGWEVGTYYGEPLFKSFDKDKLIEPMMQGYYVHAPMKDFRDRAYIRQWS